MQTHTIRNKSKQPILRFSEKFLGMLKTCYPEAVSLVLTKFRKDYLQHTAKYITIDYEQKEELSICLFGSSDTYDGCWSSKFAALPNEAYRMKQIFEDGFIMQSISDFQEDLQIAQSFYKMLDVTYLKQTTNLKETK